MAIICDDDLKVLKSLIENFVSSENKYIMLSALNASKEKGLSIPHMFKEDGKMYVTLFYDIAIAHEYTKLYGYEEIDGHSPIAELPKGEKSLIRYLLSLLNNGVDTVAIIGPGNDSCEYDIMRLILSISTNLDASYNEIILRPLSILGLAGGV